MSKQPEALRMAEKLEHPLKSVFFDDRVLVAAELRRQHALIEEMTHALKSARRALETCTPADYTTGHVIHASFCEGSVTYAENAVLAAIAKAESQS